MKDDIVEIWEPRETWLRVASMWSTCQRQATYSSLLQRYWDVMPKICGQIHVSPHPFQNGIFLEIRIGIGKNQHFDSGD